MLGGLACPFLIKPGVIVEHKPGEVNQKKRGWVIFSGARKGGGGYISEKTSMGKKKENHK